MRLKKILIVLIVLIIIRCLPAQIYNPQNEVNIKVRVVLIYESNLYEQKDFVMIKGINLTDKKLYIFEIAPRWFLKEDFFNSINPGEIINIVGAFSIGQKNIIIARTISSGLTEVVLRTEKGFPLWRVPHKK